MLGQPLDRYAASTINRRLAAITGLFAFRQMRDPDAPSPVPKGREARSATAGERTGLLAHLVHPKRVKRVGRKINRRRPRYVRGSVGKTVRVGRVGPGGEYAGIHIGAKLRTRKRRTDYYVGLSAGRRIATPY